MPTPLCAPSGGSRKREASETSGGESVAWSEPGTRLCSASGHLGVDSVDGLRAQPGGKFDLQGDVEWQLGQATALRVYRPASPKISTSRSEQPLITAGVWLKPGAQLTMPNSSSITEGEVANPDF